MNYFLKISTVVLLIGSVAWSHGEDKPGPHGGHIQMPANFHTEVVPMNDGSYQIYLLDMKFQNPTVLNSKIEVYVKNGKKKLSLKCLVAGTEYFQCQGRGASSAGSLIIKAQRNGVVATMDAKYKLPLKPFQASESQNPSDAIDHSKHH